MPSFYGSRNIGGSGEGTTPTRINVGVIAKEGYSGYPLDLFKLQDGNYNVLGTIKYGKDTVNFLTYRPCVVQTVDNVKYALYTEIKNDTVYDVLIKMVSEDNVEVLKIPHKATSGEGGSTESIINDIKSSKTTTYSSDKIESLLKQQEETVISFLSWQTN